MPHRFPNRAYPVGGGISAPRLLTRTQPDCTPEARAAEIDSSIEVVVTVGEDGIARDLRIQNGLGYGLDEKAIVCIQRWRFSPGVYEGNAVPVDVTITVPFRCTST